MLILDQAIKSHVGYGFSDSVILDPKILLIHAISNPERKDRFSAAACKAALNKYRYAAHLLIGRIGDEDGKLYELVPLTKMAYHAGRSQFRGFRHIKFGINPYSIGVEVIGAHGLDFTDKQYDTLSSVCVDFMTEYDRGAEFITGHQMAADIFARPDPKWDPGPNMDWIRLGYMTIDKWKKEKSYG